MKVLNLKGGEHIGYKDERPSEASIEKMGELSATQRPARFPTSAGSLRRRGRL